MAGFVNVRRDVDDKFYRYRMPILLTKPEGNGNGKKTVLPNIVDVARALSRPPLYPTKYFGTELGAISSFDEKNDRYIVNGTHEASRLRELLDGFIEKFVLCKSCKNPETEIVVLGKGRSETLSLDCKACGERTNVDMRHKLTPFILKHPPAKPTKKSSKQAKKPSVSEQSASGNGDASGGGAQAEGGTPDPVAPVEEEEDDDELTKKIKAGAAELTEESTLAKEAWSVDTSPEAVKQRVAALEGGFANLGLGVSGQPEEGSDDDANSPYGQLERWVEEHRGDLDIVATYKKVEELGIEKKHKTAVVLAESLFTADAVAEIPRYAPLFAKLITSEKHQKSLLGGIERLVGNKYPTELIPVVPKILMEFYQRDLLEEEVISQWGTHVSKKYVDKDVSKKVRKASEPFLKWLEEADDEDD